MPYSLLKIYTDPKKYNKQNINIYICILAIKLRASDNNRGLFHPLDAKWLRARADHRNTISHSRVLAHLQSSSNKMTIPRRGSLAGYQDIKIFSKGLSRNAIIGNKSTVWSQLKALATVKCSSSLKSETSKGWMLNPGRFPCLSIVSMWGLPEQPSKASHLHMQKFEGPGRRGLLGLLLSVWLEPERPQVVMCSWPCFVVSVCYVLWSQLDSWCWLSLENSHLFWPTTLKIKWSKLCGILCGISPERVPMRPNDPQSEQFDDFWCTKSLKLSTW